MKMAEIRKMKIEEIEKEITHQYLELKNIKSSIRLGKESDVSKNLKIKRNIARMLTVLTQLKKEVNGNESK